MTRISYILITFMALTTGCTRLECTPAGVPGCKAASVCCAYKGDELYDSCYIHSETGRDYSCQADDCLEAVEGWMKTACN